MYLTDDKAGLYDFGFQSAEVKGNSFTANISTAANADNKLLVVWPSSATALGSSDAVVRMSGSVSLKSTDPFNGKFGVSAPETDAGELADVVLLKLQEI